ncbi:hypothetical protein EJ06DRAFT_556918 [Trichodelitschia bisporula]|uniref:Transcription factor Nrm1/Whi5 n=1 Tax=Trichodelitschia bisporula TaxID=703511 RepID=A0A6G1HVQ2_9PEZI|nr:hypothetical protein EJ06DRAFT_556918 [Trichodelitschia bisporula]
MATELSEPQPEVVASKVLRRAQVSKMTRALQNRLALANVKIKHGWENLSLETLEPKLDLELRRKRRAPSPSAHDVLSDTSSSLSDRFLPPTAIDSSPLPPPLFSSPLNPPTGLSRPKRPRTTHYPASSSHARVKVRAPPNWKSAHALPASSPGYARRGPSTGMPTPTLAFITASPPPPPLLSEDDDSDLPTLAPSPRRSRAQPRSQPRSSPPRAPRTPPPGLARSARLRSRPFTNPPRDRERAAPDPAADLLLFLAASPSPAQPRAERGNGSGMQPPSTPPLPSSVMGTPGFGGTPGGGFSFADYLNVTPSPAQAAWRTPGMAVRTPVQRAGEGRRRLEFEFGTPGGGGGGNGVKGLGMELGGRLGGEV